jgi:hypothetical protein
LLREIVLNFLLREIFMNMRHGVGMKVGTSINKITPFGFDLISLGGFSLLEILFLSACQATFIGVQKLFELSSLILCFLRMSSCHMDDYLLAFFLHEDICDWRRRTSCDWRRTRRTICDWRGGRGSLIGGGRGSLIGGSFSKARPKNKHK